MSTIRFFAITAVLFCGITNFSIAQDRNEKQTEKSSCFSGKITLDIRHATPGNKDGAIALDIPRSAGAAKIYFVGFEVGEESSKIDRIPTGYYTIIIFDGNNCSTKIENIQVKEVL